MAAAGSTISRTELDRIMGSLKKKAAVEYKGGLDNYKQAERPPTTERTRDQRMRKKRMQDIDDARLKAKALSGAAADEEREEARKKIAPLIQEHDKVKFMRSKEIVAEALHGRIAQIEEKKRKAKIEQAFDEKKRKEAMRILARQNEEEEARKREIARKNAEFAASLTEQVDRVQQERVLGQERVIQEGEQMQRSWTAQQEKERREAVEREERARKIREEFAAANIEASKKRELVARAEAALDRKALRWMQEKALKEEARLKAEEERKAELERETARLRAMQEKASDEKAAEDERRAKRDQEKWELDWRRREQEKEEAAERRKVEQMEMLSKQIALKEELQARQAVTDRKIMKRLVKEQAQIQARLDAEQAEKIEAGRRYKVELLRQIEKNKEAEREIVNEKLKERKQLLIEAKMEEDLLAAARQESVQKMAAKGIDGKFLTDIEKVNPTADFKFKDAPAF